MGILRGLLLIILMGISRSFDGHKVIILVANHLKNTSVQSDYYLRDIQLLLNS